MQFDLRQLLILSYRQWPLGFFKSSFLSKRDYVPLRFLYPMQPVPEIIFCTVHLKCSAVNLLYFNYSSAFIGNGEHEVFAVVKLLVYTYSECA